MIEELLTPHISERFLADERYRHGHIRIINPLPGVKVLGLHIPEMKKLAQKIVKEGRHEAMIPEFRKHFLEDARCGLLYEEKMIWGMLLNRMPCSLEERLDKFRDFIPAIDNWAVCDSICSDAKWCVKKRTETWEFLQPYFKSEKEFEVRFALIMSLAHFLTDDYIDAVFERISRLNYDRIISEYEFSKTPSAEHGQVLGPVPYYVNMAVAWLLATALYKFPEKTREFANSGILPAIIIRLYVRKAKESFRTKNVSAL